MTATIKATNQFYFLITANSGKFLVATPEEASLAAPGYDFAKTLSTPQLIDGTWIEPVNVATAAQNESQPYTVNVLRKEGGVVETQTETFEHKGEALDLAREEVKWENTIHATVTHEPTGEDIYDQAGDNNPLRVHFRI